ncbi:MAG: threonine synthase [Planctomycetaceae bacterium]|nr:threonine synthase [Planctomycetaceae bacterium]
MTIWRWAEYFSDTPVENQITLGEGNTPLVRSRQIGPQAGLSQLYFKLESSNPSGSYKDRYAAAAISDMLDRGQTRSVGTSSGNTGSAVAAYCARAQIFCEIGVMETTPIGKLKQMRAYGAQVYKIKGLGLDLATSERAMKELQLKTERPDYQLQISAFRFSPRGMVGVKTISYELAEQASFLETKVEHIFSPAGGGGLTLAVARGFADLVERSELSSMPAVHCVQPSGNDTIAGPLRDGSLQGRSCSCTSEISGLQVGANVDGDAVIKICRDSGGTGYLVEDPVVWKVQQRLACEEGIFCEPAGAVALAGALEASRRGEVEKHAPIVCLVTGIGFKDPASVDRMIEGGDCPTINADQIQHQ